MAINNGKIFTITSAKGGTGKTVMTLCLAGIFKNLNKKVLIIDLDLYGGAISLSLNIDSNSDIYNLIDDLNNNRFKDLSLYIVNYKENIDVIPSLKDPRNASKIGVKYINLLLSRAVLNYDVILIDTNYFMNDINLIAFDHSDEVLYVINNDPIDLKNMKSIVSIYSNMDRKNYKIVLNNSVSKSRDCFNIFDVKNIIGRAVDYTIPASFHLSNIEKYILDGEILTLNKYICSKNKKVIKNLNLLATDLLKESK